MHRTPLGQTTVSAIGLGCAAMRDQPEAHATMAAALEHGCDFFDTSDLYGVGRSEHLIGQFLAQSRSPITIATKFGSIPGAPDGVGTAPRTINNHPDDIPKACEASLRRLGVQTIDLWYMHRRDPAIPLEDSIGAMSRLVEQGKVRQLGLSEVSPATLRAAHAIHPIAALQSEYSLWMRDREQDVLPVCAELGITFVPFSPLGRGFLTNTLAPDQLDPKDFRATLPRFQGQAAASNLHLVHQQAAIAARRNVTPAQLALAWLLAKSRRGPPIVPIPGTRSHARIAENTAAAAIALTDPEIAKLDALFTPEAITGARYTPEEAARANT